MYQIVIFVSTILLAVMFMSEVSAQVVPESGLKAYWSFDRCDFTDDSENEDASDGVAEGEPECVDGPEGFGMAYRFAYRKGGCIDDSRDSIRFPEVEVSAEQHSYALWFSPAEGLDVSSSRQDLLYRDTEDIDEVLAQRGRPHITLNHDQDGKLGFHARIQQPDGMPNDFDAYNNIKSVTETWQAGRWYHAAVTWDGDQFSVYIDGELQQTILEPHGPSYVYKGIVVGRRGQLEDQFNYPFCGRIDEVRMYDYALVPAQIYALAGRP